MTYYTTADELYINLQTLFTQIELSNPTAVEAILKTKMRIRLTCSDPAAAVIIDARQRPYHITYGANAYKPDLDISLATDTLHQILLGQLSLKKAIGRKQVVPQGPIFKAMALADLFRQAQSLYPQIYQGDDLNQ